MVRLRARPARTKRRLNEALELSAAEFAVLTSQSAISKTGRGGRRHLPLAFTEQGVAMLSSVLRSGRAVQVNIAIMRAFVRLREMLATHRELAHKLEQMEQRFDAQFKAVFDAIRALVDSPPRNVGRIGYRTQDP
jgi:ORF6N domain